MLAPIFNCILADPAASTDGKQRSACLERSPFTNVVSKQTTMEGALAQAQMYNTMFAMIIFLSLPFSPSFSVVTFISMLLWNVYDSGYRRY